MVVWDLVEQECLVSVVWEQDEMYNEIKMLLKTSETKIIYALQNDTSIIPR